MIRIVHMIFTNKAGRVSSISENPPDIHSVGFQPNVEGGKRLRACGAFLEKSLGMGRACVASGQEGVARRCAYRARYVSIVADHSFLGQSVEVGGQNFSSVWAGLGLIVIVDQEDDNIWFGGLFPKGRGK